MKRIAPPVVAFVGLSGSGKTTFLLRLIPELRGYGLRVGTIKHHHKDTVMDVPGKDTWRHRKAGASATILSTPSAFAMFRDVEHDLSVGELARFMSDMDIVLAEGFKTHKVPKIEVYRQGVSGSPLFLDDPLVMAIVTEEELPEASIPRFETGDVSGLAGFLLTHFNLAR